MIYLMNSAVMPAENFGTYVYSHADLNDLKAVLNGDPAGWTSAIGYPQNCELIEKWAGIRPPVNRIETRFEDGDKALVMRLKYRVVNPGAKGTPVSEKPEDWEFAWVEFRRPPTVEIVD